MYKSSPKTQRPEIVKLMMKVVDKDEYLKEDFLFYLDADEILDMAQYVERLEAR